jgi:cell division protein ZapA
MENRITVSICGTEYTLMAEESPAYMQKVAAMVDTNMSEIMAGGRINRMDAAVLAAMNIADEMLKQQGGTENLRAQLKGYLDEASKAKAEASELKRELFRLQQQMGRK